MSSDSVFTPEEISDLDMVQGVRRKLIGELTKEGVPQKAQVLLAALLDGSDRSTLTRAKMRHDKNAAENTQETVKLMAEMLKNISTKHPVREATELEREIPRELADRTFVPGEMDINNPRLSIAQVMSNT